MGTERRLKRDQWQNPSIETKKRSIFLKNTILQSVSRIRVIQFDKRLDQFTPNLPLKMTLDGGSVLGSGQFSILPQLHQKILLDSKVVKIDSKIIIPLNL